MSSTSFVAARSFEDTVGAMSSSGGSAAKLRQLEQAFKQRVEALSANYEERLTNLGGKLATMYEAVSVDQVLSQMKKDGTSLQYVQQRVDEIIRNTIASERETTIKNLMAKVAGQRAEIDSLIHDKRQLQLALGGEVERERMSASQASVTVDKLQSRIRSLEVDLKHEKQTQSRMEVEMAKMTARMQQVQKHEEGQLASSVRTSEQLKNLQEQLSRQEDEMERQRIQHLEFARNARIKERELIDRIKSKEVRMVHESESALAQRERDIMEKVSDLRLLEQEYKFSKEKLSACERKIERLESEAAVRAQALSDEKSRSRELDHSLKKVEGMFHASEQERLQLREKYISVGEKMESVLRSEDVEVSKIMVEGSEKRKRLKQQLIDERKARKREHQQYKASLNEARDKIASTEAALNEANGDLKRLEAELELRRSQETDAKGTLAQVQSTTEALYSMRTEAEISKIKTEERMKTITAQEDALRQKQREIEELRIRIDRMSSEYAAALEKQSLSSSHKLEQVQEKHKSEKQQIHQQYQMLVEQRLRELKKRAENKEYHEARVQAEVQKHITEMKKDHITIEHHKQLLSAKETTLNASFQGEQAKLMSEYEGKLHHVLKDHTDALAQKDHITEQKLNQQRAAFEEEKKVAVETVRLDVKRATDALSEEQRAKAMVEVALHKQKQLNEELRDHVSLLRNNVREEEKAKQDLMTHIEEASRNIGRLKAMVKDEQEKLKASKDEIEALISSRKEADAEHAKAIKKLETQVREAEDDSRQVHFDMKSLAEEKRLVEEKLQVAQGRIREITHEKNELNNAKSAEIEKLLKEAEALKAAHAKVEDELKQRISSLNQDIANQEKSIKQAEEMFSSEKARFETRLQEEKNNLHIKMGEWADARKALTDEISALSTAKYQLEEKVHNFEEKVLGLQTRLNDSAAHAKERQQEYAVAKTELQGEIRDREQRIRELQEQKTRIVKKGDSQRRVLQATMTKHIRTLNEQNNNLKSFVQTQLHQMQTTSAKQVSDIQWKFQGAVHAANKAAAEKLDRTVNELTNTFQQREAQVRSDAAARLESASSKAEAAAKEWERKLETTTNAHEQAVRELTIKYNAAEEKVRELERLRLELQARDNEISNMKRIVDELEGEHQKRVASDQEAKVLAASKDSLEARLLENDTRLKTTEGLLSEHQKKLKAALSELKTLKKEHISVEKNYKELREEHEAVSSQLEGVSSSKAALDSDYQEVCSALKKAEQLLDRKRAEFGSVLMVLAHDIPVEASVQKAILGEDRVAFDDAVRSVQKTIEQFISIQRANAGGKVEAAVKPLQAKVDELSTALKSYKTSSRKYEKRSAELHKQLTTYKTQVEEQRQQFEMEKMAYEDELAQTRTELEVLQNESVLASELNKVNAGAPFKNEIETLRSTIRDMESSHNQELAAREKMMENRIKEQIALIEEYGIRPSQKNDKDTNPLRIADLGPIRHTFESSTSDSAGSRGGVRYGIEESGGSLSDVRKRLNETGDIDGKEFIELLEQSLTPSIRRSVSEAASLDIETSNLLRRSFELSPRSNRRRRNRD